MANEEEEEEKVFLNIIGEPIDINDELFQDIAQLCKRWGFIDTTLALSDYCFMMSQSTEDKDEAASWLHSGKLTSNAADEPEC